MKIKELDELIKLAKKFKEEPDFEEFDEDYITDEFIEIIEIYKDFLHDEN